MSAWEHWMWKNIDRDLINELHEKLRLRVSSYIHELHEFHKFEENIFINIAKCI